MDADLLGERLRAALAGVENGVEREAGAAGGSGNGTITCLLSMERWLQHVNARVFDLIPVKRWTREHKLAAIREAARAMVQES